MLVTYLVVVIVVVVVVVVVVLWTVVLHTGSTSTDAHHGLGGHSHRGSGGVTRECCAIHDVLFANSVHK